MIAAGCAAFRQFGLHTATTRAGFGNCPPVIEVERRAAAYFGRDAAFYFSSGYVANHVLVQAVKPVAGAVFIDESAHFSVTEAANLAGGPVHRFKARDPDDLAAVIRRRLPDAAAPLVMTDAVMPATGMIAPVLEFLSVLREFAPATLLLDDAHGVGVLGPNGRGTLEHLGFWDAANGGFGADGVTIVAGGTLAKALGGFGGIVIGERRFCSPRAEVIPLF